MVAHADDQLNKEGNAMNHDEDKIKDPVCGMMVDPKQLVVEYLQLHFAFCSEQCRERFLANPGLYVGQPGQMAPKQEGREVIKRRRIHFEEPLPTGTEKALQESLYTMMGVKKVTVAGDGLEITYDLLQATAKQIEGVIVTFGARLGEGWSDRLRRSWVYFEEEVLISGMEVRSSGGHGGSCH